MSLLSKAMKWHGFGRCAVVLALALGCLTGQLSGLAHWLVVPHETCPEHGELVHGDAAPAELERPSGARAETPLLRAAKSPAGAHGHDHCIVSLLRHATAPASRPYVPAHVEPPRVAARLAHEDAPLALVPLFLIAPKNSPPASA
jgi:hypothetical protein